VGLFLSGFPSGDFPAGLPGCGFGLGLAFFGIGIMSAADFGHGVLQSGIWGDGCIRQGMQLDLEKEGILGNGLLYCRGLCRMGRDVHVVSF